MNRQYKQQPAAERVELEYMKPGGFIGKRLQANRDNWSLTALDANPAMTEIFRMRDRRPRLRLMPWSGEFAGKYLTALTEEWRMSKDISLEQQIHRLIGELEDIQDTDGYLGPFPESERLIGKTVGSKENPDFEALMHWDLWGHYHCMLGLLMYSIESRSYSGSGSEAEEREGNGAGEQRQLYSNKALEIAEKGAAYIIRFFSEDGRRIIDAGCPEMNMAVIHLLLLLYKDCGKDEYFQFAEIIEKAWEEDGAGDYVRGALAGKAFYELPTPRWESLHDIQAVAELYFLSGKSEYRQAFERLWRSIADGDRHNSGGFTTGEKAIGNPYADGAIETCCTIAWTALSVDMLRMSADPLTADELELSFLNGILGAQHPSGRWWTYNTPSDGVRRASAHDIVFQAYQGMPELNCCSVNGPRGLGMLGCWAFMRDEAGIFVNYYGPLDAAVRLPSGNLLRLRQETSYPLGAEIRIKIDPDEAEVFDLRLRIPSWSRKNRLQVIAEDEKTIKTGDSPAGPEPGRYISIKRKWKPGDEILLELDLSPHYWIGEREKTGFFSIYRGPVLLAYDQRYNSFDPDGMPSFSLPLEPAEAKREASPVHEKAARPLFSGTFRDQDGRPIVLCDFASAGAAGTEYRSWLPHTGNPSSAAFSQRMPIWTRRV